MKKSHNLKTHFYDGGREIGVRWSKNIGRSEDIPQFKESGFIVFVFLSLSPGRVLESIDRLKRPEQSIF